MSEAAPTKKERLAFIDVLRGWAVLWMIQTHVANACLAEPYRQGWLFGLLELSNGFVAVTFLFCAGAGVWLAASRKAAEFRASARRSGSTCAASASSCWWATRCTCPPSPGPS